MDQKEQLYNLYLENNLITDKVSLKMWNQMSKRQQEDIFKLGQEEGLFTDKIKVEMFTTLWDEPLKKKETSESTSAMAQDSTVLESTPVQETISSDSIQTIIPQEQEVEEEVDVSINMQEVDPTVTTAEVETDVQQPMVIPEQEDSVLGFSETPRYNPYRTQQDLKVKEKDTAIERAFGKNFLTDFFGDLYRSGAAGMAQGATLDESLELFAKGQNVTDQDIQEFIQAQQSLQLRGESDEMKDFNRIYQSEGGSIWGFIKGVVANPSVVPQIFVSSTTQLLNPSTIGAGVAGGVGGSFVPVIGTIAGAMGAAGATLETGITFAELLQDELRNRELEFNTENVRTILEDEDTLSNIRYKAAGRGVAIGIIEGATARLAGSVGAKIYRGGPLTTGRKLKAIGAGFGVEAVGGSTGEVAGRLVAGQELDVAEIGFEGIAGMATAPISVGYGIYKSPKYYVNANNTNKEVAEATAAQAQDIIDNSPDADFAKTDLQIENNPEMKAQYDKRKTEIHENAAIKLQLERAGVTDQKQIDEILPLQKQLNTLSQDTSEASKLKRSELKKQINDILQKQDTVEETTDVVEETQDTIDVVEAQKNYDKRLKRRNSSIKKVNPNFKTQGPKVGKRFTGDEIVEVQNTMDHESYNAERDGDGYTVFTRINEYAEFTDGKQTKNAKVETMRFKDKETADKYIADQYQDVLNRANEDVRKAQERLDKAQEGAQVTQQDRVTEATPEAEKRPETKRQAQPERKKIKGSKTYEIEVDAEGKAQVVLAKNGRPVKDLNSIKSQAVRKALLQEGIDVNEGRTGDQIFKEENPGVDISQVSPQQAQEITEKSENVREVAEAIETEKKVANEQRQEQIEFESLNEFDTLKLTEKEWGKFFDINELTPAIRKKYIIKQTPDELKRVGEKIEGFDAKIEGIAEKLKQDPDKVMQDFFRYAIDPPKKPKISRAKQARSPHLRNLEARFQELTGLKATRKNIEAVLEVDPNRESLQDIRVREEVRQQEMLDEEGIVPVSKKGRGVPAEKIVGQEKKKVTVDESKALKDQIKLERKAARDADRAARKKAREVSAVNKQRKTARKNIKGKIGGDQTLGVMLNRVLSVNPKIVPDSVLDKYKNIVSILGQKRGVLTLPKIQELKNEVEAIDNALNEEYSIAGELAERFEFFKRVDFSVNDKTSYEAVLNKMQEQNLITADEKALMEKYKNQIAPKEKVAKTPEAIQEEKDAAIERIKNVDGRTKVPADLSKDQKDLVRIFRKFLRNKEVLNRLEPYQLKNIAGLLDNIENGYVPHLVQVLSERMVAIDNGNKLANAVQRAKPLPFSMMYAKFKDLFTKKGAVAELIRRNPLAYVDQIFGDFKTKDMYESLFENSAKAQSAYATATKEIRNKLNKAKNDVFKSFGNDPNKTTISSYKQQLYLLQREFETNPDNKFVNPAIDVLKATIQTIDEQKTSLTAEDAKALQDILEEFSTEDGTSIDNEKLFNSFNDAEKASIRTVDEINRLNEPAAVFTASTIRGNSFNPLNNYVHHNVLFTPEADSDATAPDFVGNYLSGLRPSTKAQSLITRTGEVNPLNFDVYSSTRKGAEYVQLDYHMTSPLRTARKTVAEAKKKLEEQGRIPSDQREYINSLERAYEEVNKNVLTSDFGETTIADRAANFMSRQGYRTVLAGTGRFAAELLSNIGIALFIDQEAFSDGMNYQDLIFSDVGAKVMDNAKSTQKDRVFAEGLAGRFVDPNVVDRAEGSTGAKINSDIQNKIKQIWSFADQKWLGNVERIADFLISTPDKVVMRPMWFGTFANEFKKISGKDVDFNKLAEGDTQYIQDNKEAIDAATQKSDEITTYIGAADNPYMGILKGTSKPNDSVSKKAFNNFNNFMTRFLIFEFVTARSALHAITNNESRLTQEQGAKILAGVTTRMVTYSLLSTMLGAGLLGLFFEDDEEDKSLDKQFGQALGQTFSSLLIGRDFGNAVKAILNIGVEKFNESHLEFLRDGEYDPYKDSLQYSVLPKKQQGQGITMGDLLLRFGGSFGPALSTADLIVRKVSEPARKTPEARERQLNEQLIRMPLEIAGNLGLIPVYKDVRKVAIQEIYKDLRRAKKMKAKAPKDRKEALKQRRLKEYNEFNRNRTLWRKRNPGKPDPKRPK